MPVESRSPIPWALVGFGSGGRIFHAPLIEAEPRLDLRAVVTNDAGRRAEVAAALPKARAVASLEELAALGVRGVSISTPPATHAPLALTAIALRMHVVLDKPFAMDLAETRHIVAAAHDAGVTAIPYLNRRLDGDFRTVAALVDSGSLGAVLRFESRLDRSRPVKAGWSRQAEAGGGLLLDLGPHLVDQALVLCGPVRSVRARLDVLRHGAGAEDSFTVELAHTSGARSVLCASLAAPAAGPRFLVQGTNGGLRIDGFDGQEAALKSGHSPADLGDDWGREPNRAAIVVPAEATGADATGRRIPLQRGRWDEFYAAVAASVGEIGSPPDFRPKAEQPAPPTTEVDALAIAAVLDTARVSAREGRELPLELVGGSDPGAGGPRRPS